MKPLMILIFVFSITLFIGKLVRKPDFRLAGRIAMAVMLLFTAMGHFIYTKGMEMMLPASLPLRHEAVLLTGLVEIMAAAGLLVPKLFKATAFFLIIFFLLILPGNIYAALRYVSFQNADYSGNGPGYLWFRVPLQFFFIGWVYVSAFSKNRIMNPMEATTNINK
jgi:uncharacterized membrane protein